ncbi:uncharacterized protein LOC116269434 [Papio anubis]|uniref:uncharacterized protein LOC116269434 n=1 Tax=Papio anubis TaxID=9555 RepID=UPI0012AD8490|nr:uncharacterized protein LOC116269434 [Papio anubis]XP_031508051.1 uncharacterized protein LOC116269434 [Papio anubis]
MRGPGANGGPSRSPGGGDLGGDTRGDQGASGPASGDQVERLLELSPESSPSSSRRPRPRLRVPAATAVLAAPSGAPRTCDLQPPPQGQGARLGLWKAILKSLPLLPPCEVGVSSRSLLSGSFRFLRANLQLRVQPVNLNLNLLKKLPAAPCWRRPLSEGEAGVTRLGRISGAGTGPAARPRVPGPVGGSALSPALMTRVEGR